MPKTDIEKQQNEAIPNTPLRFVWYVGKPHLKWAVGAFVCVTIGRVLMGGTSYIYKMIVDTAQSVATGNAELGTVWFWGALYVVVINVGLGAWRMSGFLGMRWATGLNATAFNQLFAYVSKHSHGYFANRFAGSLSSAVGHASDGAQNLVQSFLWEYYSTVVSLVITIILMASVSPRVAGLFVGLIIVLVPLNIFLSKRRRPYVVAHSRQVTAVNGRAVDTFSNIAAVRQFVRGDYEIGSFREVVSLMRTKSLYQWQMSEWILVLNNLIINVFEAATLFTVLYLWSQGVLTIGDMVLIFTLLMEVMGSLLFIGNSMNGFIRRYGEIQEGLSEVLLPHEIVDVPGARQLEAYEGKIAFEHVSFAYGDQKDRAVFSGLDLVIKPGERVGLVGTSGAGKSTFVSLLLRQHELSGGTILIDGQSIAEVTQDSLRKAMAVVPQEPMLFHRSIRENIAYGKPDATEDEVVEAAKMAQAHDFICMLPHGYDTLVGERGVKLSGGQRQRIAIARAMLKNAPILILDEATSSLDSESEVAVQKALHMLMEKKTVIAIAHRLSTLREMDRILVLEQGAIVEDGTHTSLLKRGGLYASLWKHQAGGFLQEEE
ncbi:ABC transporter ATP-binding protein [Candidatus Kaiserbacteria bacterium]|nr:ABC transporter ATP-binding protein [Candidatus Kaiserbacteria bacterium]